MIQLLSDIMVILELCEYLPLEQGLRPHSVLSEEYQDSLIILCEYLPLEQGLRPRLGLATKPEVDSVSIFH